MEQNGLTYTEEQKRQILNYHSQTLMNRFSVSVDSYAMKENKEVGVLYDIKKDNSDNLIFEYKYTTDIANFEEANNVSRAVLAPKAKIINTVTLTIQPNGVINPSYDSKFTLSEDIEDDKLRELSFVKNVIQAKHEYIREQVSKEINTDNSKVYKKLFEPIKDAVIHKKVLKVSQDVYKELHTIPFHNHGESNIAKNLVDDIKQAQTKIDKYKKSKDYNSRNNQETQTFIRGIQNTLREKYVTKCNEYYRQNESGKVVNEQEFKNNISEEAQKAIAQLQGTDEMDINNVSRGIGYDANNNIFHGHPMISYLLHNGIQNLLTNNLRGSLTADQIEKDNELWAKMYLEAHQTYQENKAKLDPVYKKVLEEHKTLNIGTQNDSIRNTFG